MKIRELVNRLAEGREPSSMGAVRREIIESILCGGNPFDLEGEVRKIGPHTLAAQDSWIIFSKGPAPSRILIVEQGTHKITCHNIKGQFPDGLRALSRI